MIKFKPSPFLIPFLSLISILIFCATIEVDVKKKKPSSCFTNVDDDTQVSPFDNFNLPTNTNLTKNTIIRDEKVSSDIGYIISKKERNNPHFTAESSAESYFAEDCGGQKSKNL